MKTKKKIIRLTESDLHRIVSKTVKRVLKESSVPTYRGIPGTKFIWHGEWGSPEIIYKGESLYSDDVEDSFWTAYTDYGYKEIGHKKPTENGFEEWIAQQDKEWMQSTLDDLICFM